MNYCLLAESGYLTMLTTIKKINHKEDTTDIIHFGVKQAGISHIFRKQWNVLIGFACIQSSLLDKLQVTNYSL